MSEQDNIRPTWGGLIDRIAGVVEDGIKLLVDPDEPHQAADEPTVRRARVGDQLETPIALTSLPEGAIIKAVRWEPTGPRIVALAGPAGAPNRWSTTRQEHSVQSVSLLGWASVWQVVDLPDGDDR